MGDKTKISWADATWNMIRARNIRTGKQGWYCEHATPACINCYAERMNMKGGDTGGTGLAYKPGCRKDVEIFLAEKALLQPLHWKAPRRIFVCSMTDLFGTFIENAWWEKVFAVAALCPQHTFLVLTKRPKRMRELLSYEHTPARVTGAMFDVARLDGWEIVPQSHPALFDAQGHATIPVQWPLPNVWHGTSATSADDYPMIEDLLMTPSALHFLSAGPLLGPMDLQPYLGPGGLGWVIVEGESGPEARPMDPAWVRTIRDQAVGAGVPFHFKQWGEWRPAGAGEMPADWRDTAPGTRWRLFDGGSTCIRVGLRKAGRLLDGQEYLEVPEAA